MKKVLSLKLTAEEEEIVNLILSQGISPTNLMREALIHYLSTVYQPVYQKQQEKKHKKVYQLSIPVYQNQEKTVYQQEKKKVYQPYQTNELTHASSDYYVQHYINELSKRTKQLEMEIQDWRKRYTAQENYLRKTYTTFQTEYYTHVKDSIKRLDDKFDRIMFYLEETRKLGITQEALNQAPSNETPANTSEKVLSNQNEKRNKQNIQKKGWVLQLYRM